MASCGNPHLVDHLHAFPRFEAHLGDVPEVVELRSHPRHGAVGHDHADATTGGLASRRIADDRDGIDITRPQPAEAAIHGPQGDIARRINGPHFDRRAGDEPLSGIEVVAWPGAEIGVVGDDPDGGGKGAGLFAGSAGDRQDDHQDGRPDGHPEDCPNTDARAADDHEFHP